MISCAIAPQNNSVSLNNTQFSAIGFWKRNFLADRDFSGHDIHLYLNSVVKARTRVVYPDGTVEVATGKIRLRDPVHDRYDEGPDNLLKIWFYASVCMIVFIFVVIGVISLINN